MTPPRRRARNFHLLGFTFQVRLARRVVVEKEISWASYDPNTDEIEIDQSLSLGSRVAYLVHEAVHGIIELQGLGKFFRGRDKQARDKSEEDFVLKFIPGLMSFLRDNGVDLAPLEHLVRK